MRTATYRVIMRDEKIDVQGDHYDIGETTITLGATRPPLVITKSGEPIAIFPHGEWKALLILPAEKNGA